MFVLGNLIVVIAKILSIALNIYMWIIIIRALLSWVNPDPYNPIVMFLYRITEPVLSFVRRKLPLGSFGIDFSPMIVILVIWLLQEFLVRTLLEISVRFH
jgi:YggT family protein